MTDLDLRPAPAEPATNTERIVHYACPEPGPVMNLCASAGDEQAPDHIPVDCVVCTDIAHTAPTYCPRYGKCTCR